MPTDISNKEKMKMISDRVNAIIDAMGRLRPSNEYDADISTAELAAVMLVIAAMAKSGNWSDLKVLEIFRGAKKFLDDSMNDAVKAGLAFNFGSVSPRA